jgi:hypothetical protein
MNNPIRTTFFLLAMLLCLVTAQTVMADYLGGVTFDKVSPSYLPHGERVNINIDYKVDIPEGAIIYARPYTMGSLTPGYSASGGDIVSAGSGTVGQYFFFSSGEKAVTHVKVSMISLDQSVTYLELFVPVHYICAPHGVFNIQMNHGQHNRLPYDKRLYIDFDYGADSGGPVRILARPFTNGTLTPGYYASGSADLPPSGSYSQYFYFNQDTDVTDIRFQVFEDGYSTLLYEFFVPYDIYWREVGIYDISFDWPDFEFMHNSQNLTATFTVEHSEPDDRRAWTWCTTDGYYTPGSVYQGSAAVPAGPQTITRYSRVNEGEQDVDGVRFIYGTSSEIEMSFIVPVHYKYAPHTVQNHAFSPQSPAILSNGEDLEMTYDYVTDHAEGVRIFTRPAYDGELLYGISSAGSPAYAYPSGSGSFWLTFNAGEHLASSMYFHMTNLDQSDLLYEQFALGWWAWGSSNSITPALDAVPSATAILGKAYPNPFNPRTTIPVLLSKDTHVQLNVYNVRGLLVETIQDGDLNAGEHLFTFKGDNQPSGVYFYRMKTSSGIVSRAMALVK